MLEKIGDPNHFTVNKPSVEAVELLKRVMEQRPAPTISEIGIGVGATTLEFCKLLDHKGTIYLFDFQPKLDELGQDLRKLGYDNIKLFGNDEKPFASYSWSLAKLVLEMRSLRQDGLFDFVYLDGAHLFHHDAAATVLLKELLKPGGVLLLDDYLWMVATSPTMRPSLKPEVLEQFSDEQINTPHVKLCCDLFLDPDPAFEKLDMGLQEKERKRAYRKREMR